MSSSTQSWRRQVVAHLTESDLFRPVLSSARQPIQVHGLSGSLSGFLIARMHAQSKGPLLCLVDSEDTAAYLISDLEQILAGSSEAVLFPASNRRVYDPGHVEDSGRIVQRLDVLRSLADAFAGIVVVPSSSIVEYIESPNELIAAVRVVRVDETVPFEAFVAELRSAGFRDVDFVEEPGEFAVRGGIIDVYPFAGEYPVRLEFFGDEVSSIREFDPRSQRSLSTRSEVHVVPDVRGDATLRTSSIFDYLPENATLVVLHFDAVVGASSRFLESVRHAYDRLESGNAHLMEPPEFFYTSAAEIIDAQRGRPVVYVGNAPSKITTIQLQSSPQPPANGQIRLLSAQIRKNSRRAWNTLILCDSRGQLARLEELLGEVSDDFRYELHLASLHEGFEIPSAGLAVYTDHQIFNRFHRPSLRARRKRLGGLTLNELKSLKPGDFVVHVDHGIGRFGGLERIEVRGKARESVRLLYQDQDLLYVSVNALHKIHKYSGSEGHKPQITRLGSGQWERSKRKAKKRVKELARDLIALYAKRKSSPGFAFSPDSIWQRELEASFQYEDTPDQERASREVKADMEQPTPMDRLVCGDVGFGKTEIAVRAAFKAVQDGKQVAVLVPTTVLAAQHETTFAQRLGQYPVRVDVLSRFRTKGEQSKTIAGLESGNVDVVIGTQRLVSKDVAFKDLGLLVVDEEQRFGVSVKERLRKLRASVDTLTLTATPIPRTLQFSLLGARDLSIMSTAPPNRQPIATEIHSADRDLVRDAILYEVHRGGQVFFVHNRVRTIAETAEMLRALVPDVRFAVAHGQMKPRDLERVMMQYMEHKFDVLVCTNIVESGLDVTSANTIIIDRADRFGLADLHQLRGRVGRSDQKAFCFLLTPSLDSLTREARQRLQSIEEFSDLGSGFSIAMRDLDIRGAGNLLGSQQSGFINEVGYETYHRILDEAVRELRHEEFSSILGDHDEMPPVECTVDVEVDALFSSDYVREPNERLNLYRRLSESSSHQELEDVKDELVDRFGPLPLSAANLLDATRLRLLGSSLRLSRVQFKNNRLFLSFPTQEEDPVFFESVFQPLIERLDHPDRRVILKQGSKRVRLIAQDVPDLQTAIEVMSVLGAKLDGPGTQTDR